MQSSKKGRNPNDDLREQLRNIKSENMGLKRTIMGKEKRISNIVKCGDEYREKFKKLEAEHRVQMEKHLNEVKRLQRDNERLNNEIEAKKADRGEKENAHVEVGSEIQELRSELEAVEGERKELADTRSVMDFNIEMTQRIIEEYENELATVKEEMEPSAIKLNEITQANEVKTREVDNALVRLDEIKQTRKAKQAANDDLKEKIKQMASTLDTFVRDVEMNVKEAKDVKSNVERENAMIEREFSIWRLEAKIRLNDKQNQIYAARESIAALEAQATASNKKTGCFTKLFRRLFRRR